MKINIMIFLIIVLLFTNLSCITTKKDVEYNDALKEINCGNIDFAFMKLKNYLREYPHSIHAREVRFAIAEYYLQIKDYSDAINKLVEYIRDYPQDESVIFAQVLLYKLLQECKRQPQLIEKIKNNFFSRSLFLIFSEAKIRYYNSILNNTYKIVDYVDRIEIFKNEDLYFKILP